MRIVVLKSISYTGTTWINSVLANHKDAFYLGPPDRIWKLPGEQHPHACLIHRAGTCPFWNEFLPRYRSVKRFLPQLIDFMGPKVIVMANPTPDFSQRELDQGGIEYKEVYVVRDGRAVTHSLLRHSPDQYGSFQEGLRNWLLPAMRVIRDGYLARKGQAYWLKYEDMIQDPGPVLSRLGAFTGLGHSLDSLRYWESEVHPTAGNIGTIDVLARMQGMDGIVHHRKDYYDRLVERAGSEPLVPVIDNSWQDALRREDRLAYDVWAGRLHETFGYERDRFSPEEIEAFAT